ISRTSSYQLVLPRILFNMLRSPLDGRLCRSIQFGSRSPRMLRCRFNRSQPNRIMTERAIEEYRIADEPYYLPVDHEIDLFEAAHAARLPVILKGPTGCGKTRFVEHMAWRLERPLITVACHEDLSSTDLVGRFLIEGEETGWHDGPRTSAVRHGAICYLDEVVEARKDTVVIIHPLTDHRRRLPIEKRGTILDAPPDFMLVVSYNPGYQSILKDLKQSTRQR